MKIAVVIPAYKVTSHVMGVLSGIGKEVSKIYVVDDACPDGSGKLVVSSSNDPRVAVLFNKENQGVGGAVITGYRAALSDKMDIVVKIDGDGQMDPSLLPIFVKPILDGEVDYTKGNRFQSFFAVRQMPKMRLLGNALLSFITKLSSGYWRTFDPTNGYTAIHEMALRRLELDKLNKRYFFESDMLIMLSDARAVVEDIAMEALYGDEVSGLKISSVSFQFLIRHVKATVRRILYSYFFRDFNFASLNLLFGCVLFSFGGIIGAVNWYSSIISNTPATTGTVMVSVLPIILGFQLLMFFLSFDIANVPTSPVQKTGALRFTKSDD